MTPQDPHSFDSANGANGANLPPFPLTERETSGALVPVEHLPPVLSSSPSLPTLLQALRRRWVLAAGLGLVLSLGSLAVVWFFLPSNFQARTLLHVTSYRPKILYETQEGKPDFQSYQRTQATLAKSRLVLNAALRDPKVADLSLVRQQADPVEWLEKEIKTDFATAPEILRISMKGDHPEEMKVLVDAVRDSYLKEIVNKENNLRLAHLEKLRKLATSYDSALREKRRTLKEMVEVLGSKDSKTLALKQQFALTQLNNIQSELLNYQSELRKLQVAALPLESKDGKVVEPVLPETLIEETIKKDPLILNYRASITLIQADLADIQARVRNPELTKSYRDGIKAIEVAKKNVETRSQQIRPQVIQDLREEYRAHVAQSREQMATIKKLEADLTKLVERRTQDLFTLNKSAADLEWLRDEIAQVEEVSKRVGHEVQALQIEIQAPPRVTLLEEAVATRQSAARQMMYLLLAGLGPLGLVLMGVSWWEFRARRVNNIGEVVHGLGLKLVGTLPTLPLHSRRFDAHAGNRDFFWQNLLRESVDSTRTLLVHRAQREDLRVVMVTSACGGEGKTLLSSQLSASLARGGYKTLLLDGDLRSPTLHRLLNLPLKPGFSALVHDEAELGDVIQPGPMTNLWFLPAGQDENRPLKPISHGHMQAIFQKLRKEFDFVVVDSAPVLAVADSLVLSQHVDGVILSILRDVSRLPMVYTAFQKLEDLNIKILGAVVNGTHPETYGNPSKYYSRPASA